MVELDQFKYRISGYDAQIENIKQSLDLDSKKKRIEELEADMEAPGFWDDPDKSNKAMKELKTLKDSFEGYNSLKSGLEDINTLIEMADEMQDDSLISEIEDEITVLLPLDSAVSSIENFFLRLITGITSPLRLTIPLMYFIALGTGTTSTCLSID